MTAIQTRPVRRREDVRLLTGKGNYAADAHPPGLLQAVLLRSPYAHARIAGIDTAAAAAMPGVVAVFTAADLTDVAPIPGGINFPRPDGGPSAKTDRWLLAKDRVRFLGEPVAMVVAETRAAGLEAAEAILVDYDERPLVTDPVAAMQPGAPAVWDEVPDNIGFLWKRGDQDAVEAGLKSAAHVTRLEFSVSRVTANSMEPRGVWAELGQDGRMVVHASHQSPFALRNGLANGNFKLKPTDIRVLAEDVGGSFGMKSGVHQEVGTRRLGRSAAAAPGALDRRPDRGVPHRRAGAGDAHHRRTRAGRRPSFHRVEGAVGREPGRLYVRPLRLVRGQYRRHRRRV